MTPAGLLVLVATPIGNLEDLAPRAIRTLAEADLVVCEDTRRTGRLLASSGVKAHQLLAMHAHNEASQVEAVLARLLIGETVAMVTDAGLPGISDPGERLVRAAVAAGVEVRVVPGPSAGLAGLVMSGFPTERFVFEGFLPRRGSQREKRLGELAGERRTIVLYEAPHRLRRTLADLAAALGGERGVALCREITKLHEEVWRGDLDDAIAHSDEVEPRGEYVVVLDRGPEPEPADDQVLIAAVETAISSGMSHRDAVALVAGSHDVPKRHVYDLTLGSAKRRRAVGAETAHPSP
ncbi:MAG: 16S rRNA (cytidine(1402)-2'-O)-methyltransferase [Actinobacteria bacterium]|nr:16S rRNA (cytidine(1402)-2'-O)-methyltransferase [Actinomycetota bacterium]